MWRRPNTEKTKKTEKPDVVSKFVEPFLLQIVAPLLFVFWWVFFFLKN
jgi:hypothetical protein